MKDQPRVRGEPSVETHGCSPAAIISLASDSGALNDRLIYAVGRLLVYGPLKNALGMSRVRVAYTAGEAIGPDLFLFYRSLGINLKQLYGMTESSVFLCIQKDGEVKPDTVGPPIPGVEMRIAENGEVMFRSPGAFRAYYKNPAATEEAKAPDGWAGANDLTPFRSSGPSNTISASPTWGMRSGGTKSKSTDRWMKETARSVTGALERSWRSPSKGTVPF